MADDAKKNTVPLKKVVLYKHGMGYFERRGTVEGATSVEILCGASDIDDMLKSLMVLTADSTRVEAITYDSAKTLEDRMTEFGFDVRGAGGLIDIIAQMKGLPVTVVSSGTSNSGRVVGLDFLESAVDKRVLREPFLILLNDATFRRISLASISDITVDDAAFSTELNQQLELLFQNAKKKDKKALTVNLPATNGEVVVAYSIPSPIWKTSYRLVLVQDRLLMQGMAIVDNVQDEDWQSVQMILVSAAPISFIQPLYDPIQPIRKRVLPQGYQSAGPVVAERAQRQSLLMGAMQAPGAAGSGAYRAESANDSWNEVDTMALSAGWGSPQPAAAPMEEHEPMYQMFARDYAAGSGASPDVETASSGELFEYKISSPVTVPRNTSALIPIVQQEIEGQRVSLFNSHKDRKHPYCAIRLVNTSGLTLEGGPVTVVDEDAYAGEALLDVLKPGDSRILPYALDQDCHVIIRNEFDEQPLYRVRLYAQTLYMDYRRRTTTIYRIENVSDKKKRIYVEHPVNPTMAIIGDPKPTESTQNYHRFEFDLEGKQLHELAVCEEQELARTIWMGDPEHFDRDGCKYLVEQNIFNKEMSEWLQKVLTKQAEISKLLDKRTDLQARIQQYGNDQARARENLKAVGVSNERYRKAIDEAEDKIIKANAELQTLHDQYNARRAEFVELVQQQLETEVSGK